MADGRHIAKSWERYNSSINGPIWMKLGGRMMRLPWQRPLPSNGALYIQQWASGGRTREPILLKYNSKLGPE